MSYSLPMKYVNIFKQSLLLFIISSCVNNNINTNPSYVEKKIRYNNESFLAFDNKIKSVIFIAEPRTKGIYEKSISVFSLNNYDATLSIANYEEALFQYFTNEKRYNCYIRKSNYINKSNQGLRGYQFFYTCP